MFGTGRLTLGLVPDPTGWPASDTDHRKHSVAVVADLLNGKVEDREPRIPGWINFLQALILVNQAVLSVSSSSLGSDPERWLLAFYANTNNIIDSVSCCDEGQSLEMFVWTFCGLSLDSPSILFPCKGMWQSGLGTGGSLLRLSVNWWTSSDTMKKQLITVSRILTITFLSLYCHSTIPVHLSACLLIN